uniref:Uncharacterized protein n=1 Tax=Anguilla anguilla TaxID=7936 RepID=A0A0E9RV70_ANGAN
MLFDWFPRQVVLCDNREYKGCPSLRFQIRNLRIQ